MAKTEAGGFHPLGQALYDATNPDARTHYWANIDTALFQKGVDAWWLDTTNRRPRGSEDNILVITKCTIGRGDRYANIYPLFTTTSGVPEGQQKASDKKRVFILSRSAYAGTQRQCGVTAWSGDVLSPTGDTFRRQIPAGLNYSISGMPYWTTDIGGFISGGNLKDPKYPRAVCALVPVRSIFDRFSVCTERGIRMRTSCGRMGRTRRRSWWIMTIALSPAAVYLLGGVAGNEQARHADAAAGDGLAQRCRCAEHGR